MHNVKEIVPIAIPGIHSRFFHYLKLHLSCSKPKIIDIGAGHGYLVKKLHEANYDIDAADLFPEIFYYDKIICKKIDITQNLPLADNSYDILLAVEVMEHIHDHDLFFGEAHRILKPNGKLIFTTPNILSLKSRIRFLFSGFYYSFKPLDHNNNDGLQHVASLTIDQYRNLAIRNGFNKINFDIDKRQRTSVILLFLLPLLKLYCIIKKIDYNVHNKIDMLTGRILFVSVSK